MIGGTLGVLTALKRGWLDQAISRVVDALLAIPVLIFALMLLAVYGKSIINLVFILALLDSTRVFRLARATALLTASSARRTCISAALLLCAISSAATRELTLSSTSQAGK